MAKKVKNNIPNIAYKDFLVNQKTLPKREDKKYVDFWLTHINYCKSGVNVGGIYLSGWLYWHLNFFKITMDYLDEYGNPAMGVTNLDFRDNEFYFETAFRETDTTDKLPIAAVGTRRFAKSVMLASRIAFKAFVFQNTHAVLVGASTADINNITKYFDEFYEKRPDCFSDLMKFGDWTKTGADVEIAYNRRVVQTDKKKTNPITSKLLEIGTDNKYVFSRIAVRNLEHGQVKSKEELLAGITPTEVIWDEGAKYSWSKQHSALLPAIESKFGKRCTEVFCATGGNMDMSKDMEDAFLTTEKSNFFHFDLNIYRELVHEKYFPYRQKSDLKVSLFVPAEMSLAGGEKLNIPLSEYVNKEYSEQDLKDLEGFNIQVTDWENAREKVQKLIDAEQHKSDKEYKKAQMYYPFQPEDCFLYSGSNPFPIEDAAKAQKALLETGLTGEYVDLENDGDGGIRIIESDKKPVTTYPYEGGAYDAPIIMFERPISKDPSKIKYGSYVAGFDGYKIATSETSDSLGVITVYKRNIGITGYQQQIVATLATRPTQDKKFYNQVFMLLKAYNAELLPERDTNLYKHFEELNAKGIPALKYWANCKSLVQGITPKSTAATDYGLPSTNQTKEHYMKLIQNYCNEEILQGYDTNDEPIFQKGIWRIHDTMLLEEIKTFGKHKNYDRLIAFGHALAWDAQLSVYRIDGGVDTEKKTGAGVNKLLGNIKKRQNRYFI